MEKLKAWDLTKVKSKQEVIDEARTTGAKVHFVSPMDTCWRQSAVPAPEDAPKFLKIPKSECPDIWIRPPRHKWHKSWSSMEDPVVPLERNLYGHPLAGLLWERQFWEHPIETWLGQNSKLGMSLCTPWSRIILICVCGWYQSGWKNNPMWKEFDKEVDLWEPTSFLHHVIEGCTQR